MRTRTIIALLSGCLLGTQVFADVAKHTTVNLEGGRVTDITEMVADDNGNLRIENYRADASGNRGALDSFIVFQPEASRMVTLSGGHCEAIDLAGDELPGGVSRDEVAAARAEMQEALEQMRAQNPEMAKMLEAQMGSGMAAMMGGEPPNIEVVQTGQEKTVEGYETTSFRVDGIPVVGSYTVWAADIDDVDGGRTMANASKGMMQAHRQMMENMGMGDMFGASAFGEILDAMDDYYPIETQTGSVTTRLVSTDGNGSEDFNPSCN